VIKWNYNERHASLRILSSKHQSIWSDQQNVRLMERLPTVTSRFAGIAYQGQICEKRNSHRCQYANICVLKCDSIYFINVPKAPVVFIFKTICTEICGWWSVAIIVTRIFWIKSVIYHYNSPNYEGFPKGFATPSILQSTSTGNVCNFFCGYFWMSPRLLLLQRRGTISFLAHAQGVVKNGMVWWCTF
jgi:hypothetical protein